MKKLLIASLLLTGLAALAPKASAHDCDRDRYDRYSYYDRPVYREVYRPSYGYYEDRPQYYRPAPVYRSYSDDYCRPRYRTNHRSVLSFVFGF